MAAFMQQWVQFLEGLFTAIPLPILEIWGRLAYFIGLLLALFAFGGFSFTPRGRWGLGRIRQNWNSRALLCAGLTFAAVPLAGWLGSNIVLVEGAQTFESLKDVVVFLAIVLFGYPALLAVPPGFVFDWILGYFAWAAFVWVAAQLIGRRPDFRRLKVWAGYLAFVGILTAFDPVMWGFICAQQFTSKIAYTVVTPALAATLGITWLCAPLFMGAALPLAARYGLFWASSRGYVREHRLGSRLARRVSRGLPLRLVLAGSFIALTLALVGGVAFVAVQSGQKTAEQLAMALHTEAAVTLNLQLDAYLDRQTRQPLRERLRSVAQVLADSSIAAQGRVYMIDRQGRLLAASSAIERDGGVAQAGLTRLNELGWALPAISTPEAFRFAVISAKPLARETWLAQITPYSDTQRELDVLVITAMPESHYLASMQTGGSRAATLSALALTAALALAALLASLVARPIEQLADSARTLAGGELTHRVPTGAVQEVNGLVQAFNGMAEQLQALLGRTRASEASAKALFNTSPAAMAVFNMTHTDLEHLQGTPSPRCIDTNLAWEQVTGFSAEFSLGKTSLELGFWTSTDDRQRLASLLVRHVTVRGFATRLRRADGSFIDAEISGQCVEIGADKLLIFVIEDVSAERQAHAELHSLNQRLLATQAELMDLNAGLDLRVRDRTHELQAALDNLRRTQDQLVQSEKLAGLGHIVARVAHEMNTPLGIAVTSGSTLQDYARSLQAKVEDGQLRRSDLLNFLDTLRTGLDLTLGALDRAHRLVSDFKQVAVDHGSEHRRRFQLHDCVAATQTLLHVTMRRTPYELVVEVPPGIAMDSYPGAIEQLLINLFNNALLHAFEGREHGRLRFSAEQAGAEVVMVFEDDGRGMPEAVRRRVYDPFFTTKAGSGGSGLGLTICFNLVTGSLGGQIDVHSREGEGTRFVVRLPCVAPLRELRAPA